MNTKPTIFFVHGAWHQSAHYSSIIKRLEADGFPAVAPTQPTFDPTPEGLKTLTLHDDADFIKAELTKLVESGKEVVVVMHSYGGAVGTQAVHESLGAKQRAAMGKLGGVVRLVYMAAFLLPPNSSLGDALGGALPPFIIVADDGSCLMDDPRHLFYNALSDAEAQPLLDLNRPHVARVQLTRLTYTAYLHHPISYIVATEDTALLPEYQYGMIAGSRDNGLEIDVHEVAADHSPYLCKEAETVTIIENIARGNSRASV